MSRILIIEDNADLAFGLRSNLELDGHDVSVAATGPAGLRQALDKSPDLIVLDVMLPEMHGFDVLREFRKREKTTPVLMLTARGEEMDKVRGLRSGADDYVTKPFGLMELLARIEALLRRTQPGSVQTPISVRNLEIDTATRRVRRGDEYIDLSPKEFDLLVELARNSGTTLSRTHLIHAVWGHSPAVVSRTVDTHIAELRRKLDSSYARSSLIVTVRKAGYRIEPG